jgi:hypothetical protein
MAKGGAFGNPLTTGIALNFEVDMTPYRQMMQDNLQFAQTQAAERKKKEKEFQDILKNITYDDSKILKRRRDGARVEYASLINDVINLNKNGDRGGVQNRIADFRSRMNNLVDEKTNFNLYEKAAREGKSWTSAEYINAMNGLNEGETSDESIIKLYPDEIDYDSKSGTFASQAIPKADAMSWANKILQGMPLKSTNLKPELVPETGEYRFPLSKVEDPEAFYKEMGALWLGGGESHVETMRREMNLNSDDLDGTGAIDNSTKYMRFLFQNKVGGDRYGRPAKDTGKTGYTRPGVMGKVQIAEAQTTPISREAFNIDEYKSGAQPVIESKVLDILKQQGANNEKGVKAELENLLQKLVIVEDVNDYFSDENLISVAAAVGEDTYGTPVEIDLNDQAAAAKKIAEVLSGASDENLKAIGNNIGFEYAAPSSVIKDFDKTAQVSTFGGDVRKSYEMPKGEIYMVGSKGAQVVKIRNGINVAGSLFKSFNRDKDGKIWHGIDFPVEEQSAITSLLEQALGRESIDDFIKSNGIPKTFYVPETQKNVATFLTTDSQGKLTPEFLDAELKKIGVYGSGTQPSESSGEEEVDEFGFPIEN